MFKTFHANVIHATHISLSTLKIMSSSKKSNLLFALKGRNQLSHSFSNILKQFFHCAIDLFLCKLLENCFVSFRHFLFKNEKKIQIWLYVIGMSFSYLYWCIIHCMDLKKIHTSINET